MRLILLGGAPGAGKTETARALLRHAGVGHELVQWVDVDALWSHQPWRVDDATVQMLHANLRAVLVNAEQAGVSSVIVTWVFQDESLHELVIGLAPPEAEVETIQLVLDEGEWRRRFADDSRRPAVTAFFEDRYRLAQSTLVDHRIDVTAITADEAAQELSRLLGIGNGSTG